MTYCKRERNGGTKLTKKHECQKEKNYLELKLLKSTYGTLQSDVITTPYVSTIDQINVSHLKQ